VFILSIDKIALQSARQDAEPARTLI
jgi:hypothetical protein